jgi:hypothetical protein
MSIEHDLRRALRPKQPPDGFMQRVLARIHNERTAHSERAYARRPHARWLAAAAAVLLMTGGTWQYLRHQQMRSKTAKAEVMAALTIASEKLQLVRQMVSDQLVSR